MDKLHLAPDSREPGSRESSVDREYVVGPRREYFSTPNHPKPNTAMSNERDSTQGRRKVQKLVLCFDGTGNKFHGDDSDSNILKIFRMLDRTASDQCKTSSSKWLTLAHANFQN